VGKEIHGEGCHESCYGSCTVFGLFASGALLNLKIPPQDLIALVSPYNWKAIIKYGSRVCTPEHFTGYFLRLLNVHGSVSASRSRQYGCQKLSTGTWQLEGSVPQDVGVVQRWECIASFGGGLHDILS